jgi:hypothetical protein
MAPACAEGESSHFVLPFFFAMPGGWAGGVARAERAAAGHLELPRCVHRGDFGPEFGCRLRLLAGGPLREVKVRVSDPRTGQLIAEPTSVTLLAPGDDVTLALATRAL